MSSRIVRLSVPDEAAGVRLDAFLAAANPGRSRSIWKRLIEEGRVEVDGRKAGKPSIAVQPGMAISADLPDAATPGHLQGESIPIDVVYEDGDLAVVMKPAGLVVHPGAGHTGGTLVHALLGRGMELTDAAGKDRPGIVHRLDRDTSGLLIVAKSEPAYRALTRMFARREIKKTYLALVWGHPRPPNGRIDETIGRSRRDPKKMTVRPGRGREATTLYKTLEALPGAAILEIDLVTGRTHQIRVHFASRHHPVLGDKTYGGMPWKGVRDVSRRTLLSSLPRLALHAARLSFSHPVEGRPLTFSAPLPHDLVGLADELRRGPR